MNAFDLLQPTLQYHIVNSLGWQTLRPLQEQSIQPIISGKHALLLAPTAGGKTEAAVLPLLSRMMAEQWQGLSVLYICPLKALLNNLTERLIRYASLVGRSVAVWHGDTSATKRKQILAEIPDIILTTPESVEAMLISTRADNMALFHQLRTIVIDEIHAFAGDDRGWHLLSVIERLSKLADRELQRIGLSATVGNPQELVTWFTGFCNNTGEIVAEQAAGNKQVDIKLDFTGNLYNAALVISRLHHGKKRLVFCDSRARVEQLSSNLRSMGINTFVSHSSLSRHERKRSEDAFQHGENCVIVATSALELGIDIGDLDHVIQIDAPATVSSFLQRLGRTGRRPGSVANCLFLATSDQCLIQAAALIELWSRQFVEPIVPPPCPYHVFAQQILGLILQEKGTGVVAWRDWFASVPAFAEMDNNTCVEIIQYMLNSGILAQDQGLIWFGKEGEKQYGFRNFMELCSIFTTPPLFTVKHGRSEIGCVSEVTFTGNASRQVILLGGKCWKLKNLDWNRKIAWVEPTELDGKSRWLGSGPFLSTKVCYAIKNILLNENFSDKWSKRAVNRITDLRCEYDWLLENTTAIVTDDNGSIWWTFAGKLANMTLALIIRYSLEITTWADNLCIKMNPAISQAKIKKLQKINIEELLDNIDFATFTSALPQYKFHSCLPENIIREMAKHRFYKVKQVQELLNQKIDYVK